MVVDANASKDGVRAIQRDWPCLQRRRWVEANGSPTKSQIEAVLRII